MHEFECTTAILFRILHDDKFVFSDAAQCLITLTLTFFYFRDQQAQFMIIVCPTSTTVGVLNGMAIIITRIMEVKQLEVATMAAAVADVRTMTQISNEAGNHCENNNRMLNLRPSYLLVKQPAKAPQGRWSRTAVTRHRFCGKKDEFSDAIEGGPIALSFSPIGLPDYLLDLISWCRALADCAKFSCFNSWRRCDLLFCTSAQLFSLSSEAALLL